MLHRMTLENGRTGTRYVVMLTGGSEGWQAEWHAERSDGVKLPGLGGKYSSEEADLVFRHVKRALEEVDEDIIDVDWQFEEPLPPWLLE
jgi:hypothetical protein